MTALANLNAEELTALVQRVFEPQQADRALAVIVDLPDAALVDNPDWRQRREIAADWVRQLLAARPAHGLEVHLYVYRNVRANNADLPAEAWRSQPDGVPATADELEPGQGEPFDQVLGAHTLVLAPTELSATAPLKVMARRLGFRAATMPGFSPEMIPALRIDYGEVNRRVGLLKARLDEAVGADLRFFSETTGEHLLHLDLRHRLAHASGGLLPTPGTAGNLPSGEAYIVPYEGEHQGDPTASAGELPVQHPGDNEVVVYRITNNVATEVLTSGPRSASEATQLRAEPAYGNLAELGLGVLDEFGIEPIGEVLLDEKLGLHIAFGRSEHFGGQVGPDRFSCPEAVIHQDHVYIEAIQPMITATEVDLLFGDGSRLALIRNGSYVIDFG